MSKILKHIFPSSFYNLTTVLGAAIAALSFGLILFLMLLESVAVVASAKDPAELANGFTERLVETLHARRVGVLERGRNSLRTRVLCCAAKVGCVVRALGCTSRC